MNRNKNTGQFVKGSTPWNKGKKTGIIPKNSFKKGHHSSNSLPIGSEREYNGLIFVKNKDNRWVEKKKIVYERENGSVKKGNVLIFLDGNRKNTNIENIFMVTKREIYIMNRFHFFSENPEITLANILIIRIKDKIKEVTK